jgi:phosphatidate cytidylyltransferase
VTRILSAVVLLVIVIGTVWFLPPIATLALALVASAAAFYEYAEISAALGARIPRLVCGAAVAAVCALVGLGAPVVIALLSALVIIGALAVAAGRPGPGVLLDASAAILPLVYIGVPLGALAQIRSAAGREAVLLLAIVIIVSDSAQYYTGRALGRRPLAPTISPKKTVEGAVGGMVCATIAFAIGARWLFPATPLPVAVIAGAVLAAAGIIGDLFESLLKRSAGMKDSSALIPGHGGVLDRIDSWLFAAPVFYVFINYAIAP